jgi:hypothetical protein
MNAEQSLADELARLHGRCMQLELELGRVADELNDRTRELARYQRFVPPRLVRGMVRFGHTPVGRRLKSVALRLIPA